MATNANVHFQGEIFRLDGLWVTDNDAQEVENYAMTRCHSLCAITLGHHRMATASFSPTPSRVPTTSTPSPYIRFRPALWNFPERLTPPLWMPTHGDWLGSMCATARRELSDAATLTWRQQAHCNHWSAFAYHGIA